jgi:hypothetical protein
MPYIEQTVFRILVSHMHMALPNRQEKSLRPYVKGPLT